MRIYSVSEFREELNELLGEVVVAVQGEITDFHISQNRFVWFSLADDTTVVKCFMMSFQLREQLEEGMEIRAIGAPTLFKKGQMVFRPKRIEIVGDGNLQKEFERLKKQLDKEGLFDADRKRELPRFPQRIGLVTSSDAAAYTDVLRILENRWSGLSIVHAHVNVQGASAVGSIVTALEQLNDEYTDLDCIILTRGGGSLEDLAAFNSEEVARAVFASQIPVVAGVGHERDVTIADYVADVRASTPSNAAEIVVPHRDDVFSEVSYKVQDMEHRLQKALSERRGGVDDLVQTMDSYARSQVSRFERLSQRLHFALERFGVQVQQRRQQLSSLEQLLQSLNPQHVLERGYSITRGADGTILRSAKKAKAGEKLSTTLADGVIDSTID